MIRLFTFSIVLTALISSCNEVEKENTEKVYFNNESSVQKKEKLKFISAPHPNEMRKVVKEVEFRAKYISGLQFIDRKGFEIDQKEKEELKNEMVMFLEFKSLSQKTKNPLELEQCMYKYENAIEYLVSNIEDDIKIKQGAKTYNPEGVHFERDFSLSNRLRVLVFFNKLDHERPFALELRDRLFGGVKLRFEFIGNLIKKSNT